MTNYVEIIDQHHERKVEKPRAHLGCSLLGHHCDRWIWLSFRHAFESKFPGRVLRLFRRGHNEEPQMVSDLEAIGMKVSTQIAPGKQIGVDFGSHVSGSVDGVITYGIGFGEAVLECKTHSDKSFKDLAKHGVKKSKPQHWAQMQVYMLGLEIPLALYIAVNKNDDSYHIELIEFEQEDAEKLVKRGKIIATSNRMPPPCSTDPSWYQCKFCDGYKLCHGQQPIDNANCRTCAHSTPEQDGTWSCERHKANPIPFDFQMQGCPDHVLHPDMVPWEFRESDSEHEAIYVIDGKEVRNGPSGYASSEILDCPEFCDPTDGVINQIREQFGARIDKC